MRYHHRAARTADGLPRIRIFQERAIYVVHRCDAAVLGAIDHRFSSVLVEPGGRNHLDLRLVSGRSRLVLLAAPDFYDRAAMIIADQRGFFRGGPSISVVLIYGALVVIGIYLTYVGWLAKPASSK